MLVSRAELCCVSVSVSSPLDSAAGAEASSFGGGSVAVASGRLHDVVWVMWLPQLIKQMVSRLINTIFVTPDKLKLRVGRGFYPVLLPEHYDTQSKIQKQICISGGSINVMFLRSINGFIFWLQANLERFCVVMFSVTDHLLFFWELWNPIWS